MWHNRRGPDEHFEKPDYEERNRGSGLVPSQPVSGRVGSRRFVEAEDIRDDRHEREDER